MKNRFQLIASTITCVVLVFCITLIFSCKKDSKIAYNSTTTNQPCAKITCLNGGTCLNGICQCAVGFEGTNCNTAWSKKFTGYYLVNDNCYTGSATKYVDITDDATRPEIIKFNNMGILCPTSIIEATIGPEKTTFNIPIQNVCGNNYMSGNGNINGKIINIYLHNRDTVLHTTTNCTLVLSK
jgi:hypothetical protein